MTSADKRGPGRTAAIAGVGFVVIGAVELALTGGPAPGWDAPRGELVAYFTEEAAAGPAVAVMSAVAGVLLLVFAAVLRRRIPDPTLSDLAWGGALVMLAAAWMGQAVQQATWAFADSLAPDTVAVLGGLVGFCFAFALVGGAVLAAASGIAATGNAPLPRWLAALATVAVIVPLAGVASAAIAAVAFPAFLVWLLGASVALARATGDLEERSSTAASQSA